MLLLLSHREVVVLFDDSFWAKSRFFDHRLQRWFIIFGENRMSFNALRMNGLGLRTGRCHEPGRRMILVAKLQAFAEVELNQTAR